MKDPLELIGDAVPSGISASSVSIEFSTDAALSTDAGRWLAAHAVPAGDLKATAGRTEEERQIRQLAEAIAIIDKWKRRLELRRDLRAARGGLR